MEAHYFNSKGSNKTKMASINFVLQSCDEEKSQENHSAFPSLAKDYAPNKSHNEENCNKQTEVKRNSSITNKKVDSPPFLSKKENKKMDAKKDYAKIYDYPKKKRNDEEENVQANDVTLSSSISSIKAQYSQKEACEPCASFISTTAENSSFTKLANQSFNHDEDQLGLNLLWSDQPYITGQLGNVNSEKIDFFSDPLLESTDSPNFTNELFSFDNHLKNFFDSYKSDHTEESRGDQIDAFRNSDECREENLLVSPNLDPQGEDKTNVYDDENVENNFEVQIPVYITPSSCDPNWHENKTLSSGSITELRSSSSPIVPKNCDLIFKGKGKVIQTLREVEERRNLSSSPSICSSSKIECVSGLSRKRKKRNQESKKTTTYKRNVIRSARGIRCTYSPSFPSNSSKSSKKKEISELKNSSGCRCKFSRCLKLYCECFQQKLMCNDSCLCRDCLNTEKYEPLRTEVMESILARRPDAFEQRVKIIGAGCSCKKNK